MLGYSLLCHTKQARVAWEGMQMNSDYDGGLLAMLFMEQYNGEQNWQKDDMSVLSCLTQNASILMYRIHHKLNKANLSKDFQLRTAVRPFFFKYSSICQYLYLSTSVLPLVHSSKEANL